MILQRNIAPGFHKVDKLDLPEYIKTRLSNEVDFYSINAGNEPVIRLDLVFDAGLTQQLKKSQSSFTAAMLSEGTKNKTAIQLADSLDYFGSYFQTKSSADDATASLYCLEKHLKSCFPLFIEAITQSVFPEKELEIIKKNSIQKLLVNEKKNNYLCRKAFYNKLLGENHPYASFSEKADIKTVNTNDLITFYNNCYLTGLKYVLLSGKFANDSLNFIQSGVSNSPLTKSTIQDKTFEIKPDYGKHSINKSDSVQSAIRIGKLSIPRSHADFRPLQLLNLIFGGYFGSRLMKNIREDKGLTYGIYSGLEPYKHSSIWYIETEINNVNCNLGLEEVYKEINTILIEPVKIEEITIAKNYMLGSFLRSIDGPFSIADRIKIIIDNDLKSDYYSSFVATINSISSEHLLEIANMYLKIKDFVQIVVGKQ